MNFSKKSLPHPSLINFLKISVNLGFGNLAGDQFSNHDKSGFLFKNSYNARARYLYPYPHITTLLFISSIDVVVVDSVFYVTIISHRTGLRALAMHFRSDVSEN